MLLNAFPGLRFHHIYPKEYLMATRFIRKFSALAFMAAAVGQSWSGLANTEVVNSIEWTYTISGGEASVGSGSYVHTAVPSDTEGAITIPATLGGYPVTSIGDEAFNLCEGITSVTIPDCVRSIGAYAFDWCSSLTSVSIGKGVTSIGDSAFSSCGLTSVTIPSSVKGIGDWAFADCDDLTSIAIPGGVTSIGDSAFSGCDNLESVSIGNGVVGIGAYAFFGCKGITAMTIPASVTVIGDCAFGGCSAISSFSVDGSNSRYSSQNGHLLSKDGKTLVAGVNGNAAIPASVTLIGDYAFYECQRPASLVIPASITSIGDSAFYGCAGLESVTIPASVTNIGDCAFSWCPDVTSFTVSVDNPRYASQNGLLLTKDGKTLLAGVNGNAAIPDSVTHIGSSAFAGCGGFTSLTIPSSVKIIGDSAFDECPDLASVTICNGVTTIGDYAFAFCDSLTSVTIPASVTSVGENAFAYCDGLEALYLPKNYSGGTGGVDASKVVRYSPVQTLILDPNGGSIADGELVFTFGTEYGVLPTPTRDGWEFAGWATAQGGQMVFADGSPAAACFATPAVESVTLYAIWAKDGYTIRLDANGGEGGTAEFIMSAGTEQTLPESTFTKDGHFLLGWALTPDGDATLLDGDTTADLAAQAGETVTLYAVWQEWKSGGNGLSVKYFDISPSGYSTWTQSEAAMVDYFAAYTPTIETNTLAWGDMLDAGFQYKGSSSDANRVFSQFSGWNNVGTAATRFHGKYANQSQNNFAMLLEGKIFADVAGDCSFGIVADDAAVLYIDGTMVCGAEWSNNAFNTIHLSNGPHRINVAFFEGTGEQGLLIQWKKPGDSTFAQIPQSILSNGNLAYAIHFDANGGEGVMAKRVYASGDNITLPANSFTRDGWTFLGWGTEADGPVAYADGAAIDGCLDAANGETATLYARWGKDTYTVHFDANGGNGAMADESFWLGIPDTLTPNAFTRTGYTFAGWATTADGDVAHGDGALVTNLMETANANVNLYAVWSPNHYQVRFNSGSGTGSMPNQTITYDAATALSANTFAKTGYHFVGWATEADGEAVYDDCDEALNLAAGEGDIVDLYATWAPNGYTVVFDANGGAGTMQPQQITYDEVQPFTANAFTRASRFFAGWAMAANGAVAYADCAVVSNLTTAANGEVRLYAVWAESRVVFDANNGEGSMGTFFVFSGTEQTLPQGTFTKDGCFLLGWARTPDGEATLLDGDSTADLAAQAGETVTLYAVWHEGEGRKPQYIVVDLTSGAMAETYPVSLLDTPPDGGFNADEYKTTKLVLRRIDPGTFMMCRQYETTLTRPYYMGVFQVTQRQYELVMGNNPSQYTGDMRPVERVSYNTIRGANLGAQWPSSSGVDANSFMGKLQSRTGIGFDLPTEAQWEYACRAGTTSDYNNGGNTANNLNTLGRYYSNRYDGKGGFSQHTTVGSYLPNAWNLYDMHGNVLEWCLDWFDSLPSGEENPQGPLSGTKRLRRSGGWQNDASVSTSSHRDGYASPNVDNDSNTGFRLSLPSFSYVSAYAIRFDANGGVGTMEKRVYAAGEDVALPVMAFERDGWTFVGWGTEADGPVVFADEEEFEGGFDAANGETVTLYARWSQGQYAVHFDANGGVGAMADESFWLGIPDTLPPNAFTRTGYTFAGWATAADGGVAHGDVALVTNLTETADAIVNLYAVWSPNHYQVRFNSGSGTGSMPNQTITYDVATALSANTFTKTGYHFAGWATEEGGEKAYDDGEEILNLTTEDGAVMDFFAILTPNAYTVAFDANGGAGTMADMQFTYDEEQPLPANAFTRENRFFAGWAAAADGAVAYADGEVVSNLTATADGEVTFYAVWAEARIVFDANGGEDEVEGKMAPFNLFAGTEQTLPQGTFTMDGHFLLGWALTPDGEATLLDGDSTVDLVAQAGETVTLYAVWHEGEGGGNGLSVKYYDISSSGYSTWMQSEAAMTNYFAAYTPTMETNTLDWGETLQSGFQQNNVGSYFANYPDLWLDYASTNRYHGKYANKSQDYFAMLFEGCLQVDVAGTYLFASACDDAVVLYIDETRIVASLEWRQTPQAGSIFISQGKHRITIATYEGGGSQGMWVEWKKPGESSFSPLSQSVLTDGKAATYAIRFDANDGEGTMAKRVYAFGDEITLPANAFTRDGWTFLGWAMTPYGPVVYDDGATVCDLAYANNAAVTLYAVWAEREWAMPDYLDALGLAFETESGSEWSGDWEEFKVGGASLTSGELSPSEIEGEWTNTVLRTTVLGKGALSFWWKVSCEPEDEDYGEWYDFATFAVDGVEVARIAGESGWRKVECKIAGMGAHTLEWAFWRDDYDEDGADYDNALWVDGVDWAPAPVALSLDPDGPVFTTGGDSDWAVDATTGWTNGVSVKSGAVASGQSSWIETTVTGAGTLAFRWKVMGGIYRNTPFAYAKVEVDGTQVASTHLTDGWEGQSLTVEGVGTHTIRWTYLRTSSRAADGDCAWLDAVAWEAMAAESVVVDGVDVPVSWLEVEAAPIVAANGGSLEEAAAALAANGVNTVAECYVTGISPTNSTQVFRTVISWENGEPKISWEPELTPEEAAKRVYTEIGKTNLADKGWTEVSPANRDGMRFFKVKVEMRQ